MELEEACTQISYVLVELRASSGDGEIFRGADVWDSVDGDKHGGDEVGGEEAEARKVHRRFLASSSALRCSRTSMRMTPRTTFRTATTWTKLDDNVLRRSSGKKRRRLRTVKNIEREDNRERGAEGDSRGVNDDVPQGLLISVWFLGEDGKERQGFTSCTSGRCREK